MKKHALRVSALLVSVALTQYAFASGYHFGTQSVSDQGTANASGAAAEDATTIFSNPAGLSHVDGTTFSGVLDLVIPHGDVTDEGTHTVAIPGFAPNGKPTGGSTGGSYLNTTVVPHAYVSHKVNDQLTIGFGAFVPFGSDVKYSNDWIGRYDIIDTKLETLALNPSFAWRINKYVTFGGGVSAQYMKGRLIKGADFGTGAITTPLGSSGSLIQQIGLGAQKAAGAAAAYAAAGDAANAAKYQAVAQQLSALGSKLVTQFSGNPTYDGQVDVNADDWGYGYNFGLMFDFDEHTRLGFAYRSRISQRLTGTANWTVPTTFTNDTLLAQTTATLRAMGQTVPDLGPTIQGALQGQFTNGDASVAVDTPESYSLSFYKDVTDRLALMADVTHTRHSRLKAINIQFANGLPPANIPENWSDTTKISLGGSYKYSDSLKLRAGFMHDESPVDDNNRTPALPDGDRKWYSIGANWALSKTNSLDFAYSFVQVGDEQVHNYDNGGLAGGVCDATKNTSSCATSNIKQHVYSHIVAMQYNHKF